MKILLLSTSDVTGGAAVVSKRLVEALRAAGHEARMLVLNRNGQPEPCVEQVSVSKWRKKMAFLMERVEIFLKNGFDRRDLFKVSTASTGVAVAEHRLIKEADVLLLGWINQGFISLSQLASLIKLNKKIVWTMHDMWPMTGICHLSWGCRHFEKECGCCKYLHGRKGPDDLSHRTWLKKEQLYHRARNLQFVAVSRWLASQASMSSLLGSRTVHVVPNAITLPDNPRLNSGRRPPVIVMGAARLDDEVKNLPMAIEALNVMHRSHGAEFGGELRAVFYGGIRNVALLDNLELPFSYVGPKTSGEVFEIFNNASVVLSSSSFEMLPTTIVEGLAWGCAAVATDSGGQSDIITDGVNGYLVEINADSIAEGLYKALKLNAEPSELRKEIENKFSPEVIVSEYMNIVNL